MSRVLRRRLVKFSFPNRITFHEYNFPVATIFGCVFHPLWFVSCPPASKFVPSSGRRLICSGECCVFRSTKICCKISTFRGCASIYSSFVHSVAHFLPYVSVFSASSPNISVALVRFDRLLAFSSKSYRRPVRWLWRLRREERSPNM